MFIHLHLTEERAGTLALYALGLLSDEERFALDSHLTEGCVVCASEISRCGELLAELTNRVGADPPGALRQRFLDSIRAQVAPSPAASPLIFERDGLSVLRTSEMEWNSVAKGLAVKVLFDDTAREMTTTIVRLDPETFYPAHQHNGTEEVYVLQGELQVEGVNLQPGDFCLSRPETIHQGSYSKRGCTLMVKSSKHDQVLR